MPLKYFEIKNLLRSQIGLVDSLTGKVMKYVLLYGILYALFLIGRAQDPDSSGGLVALLLIMGVLYRFNFLFEKINIKNLTIAFRKGYFLNDEHTEMLISDIELSLKKINSFANWSCGILATISIFVTTTYLNFFKDSIPKEELSKLLIDENAGLQNDLVVFLALLMFLIILGLLGYYLAVQAFTYEMRIVNTILKSSLYIDEDDIIIGGFWKKLAHSLDHFISGF